MSGKRGVQRWGTYMTNLLQLAFARAAALPPDEQDILASRLLAELSGDSEFDDAIAASADKLTGLALEALNEHRQGLTEEIKSDRP